MSTLNTSTPPLPTNPIISTSTSNLSSLSNENPNTPSSFHNSSNRLHPLSPNSSSQPSTDLSFNSSNLTELSATQAAQIERSLDEALEQLDISLLPNVSNLSSPANSTPIVFGGVQQHNEYKQKSQSTQKKLSKFFGEDMHSLDIPVAEIRRAGLKAIMQSKAPLAYFLLYLIEEFSPENLFFFQEIEHYENSEYSNSSQQYAAASKICDAYLSTHSNFELNVDDGIRKQILSRIKSEYNPNMIFESAKRAVYIMLQNSCKRFMQSTLFDRMAWYLGEKTVKHPKVVINLIVLQIFEKTSKGFKRRQKRGQNGGTGSTPRSELERIPSIESDSSHSSRSSQDSNDSRRSSEDGCSSSVHTGIALGGNGNTPPQSVGPSEMSESQKASRSADIINMMAHDFIRYLFGVKVENRCTPDWLSKMRILHTEVEQGRLEAKREGKIRDSPGAYIFLKEKNELTPSMKEDVDERGFLAPSKKTSGAVSKTPENQGLNNNPGGNTQIQPNNLTGTGSKQAKKVSLRDQDLPKFVV